MALWVLKPGKFGEREEGMFNESIVAIGWEELPDLLDMDSKEKLRPLYESIYQDASSGRTANHVGQIHAFLNKAQIGDLIAVPHKSGPLISICKLKGKYKYRIDLGSRLTHTRTVEWLKRDIPRNQFKQDLLYSFGSLLTFCQVSRNNAEERVKILLKKEIDEGLPQIEEDSQINIVEISEERIRQYITENFKGHRLSSLIAAILRAKGYITKEGRPGPDGGADILAAAGPLGFEEPKICVQVKSLDTPADVGVYRQLSGILEPFKATYGLLVSWGGFKESVKKEARNDFFKIRLWSSKEIIDELIKNYDKLDEDFKLDLPLKRLWILSEFEED